MARRSRVLVSSGNGQCLICRGSYTATGMTSHMKRHILEAGGDRRYYVIRIDAGQGSPFWMYVQVKGSSTLQDMDIFLRDVWLECCQHASSFTIDNRTYHMPDMDIPICDVLHELTSFVHQYDTTTLRLGVIRISSRLFAEPSLADGRLNPALAGHKVSVLAIHDTVQFRCRYCQRPSSMVCTGFIMNGEGVICPQCVQQYGYDISKMRRALQSPRVGQCRYGML